MLRSEYVKAKYARQEFIYPDKQSAYCSGIKEGYLYKRGRDDRNFKKRRFVLARKDTGHTLSYYVKDRDVSTSFTHFIQIFNMLKSHHKNNYI